MQCIRCVNSLLSNLCKLSTFSLGVAKNPTDGYRESGASPVPNEKGHRNNPAPLFSNVLCVLAVLAAQQCKSPDLRFGRTRVFRTVIVGRFGFSGWRKLLEPVFVPIVYRDLLPLKPTQQRGDRSAIKGNAPTMSNINRSRSVQASGSKLPEQIQHYCLGTPFTALRRAFGLLVGVENCDCQLKPCNLVAERLHFYEKPVALFDQLLHVLLLRRHGLPHSKWLVPPTGLEPAHPPTGHGFRDRCVYQFRHGGTA